MVGSITEGGKEQSILHGPFPFSQFQGILSLRWCQQSPLKCWYLLAGLYDITSQTLIIVIKQTASLLFPWGLPDKQGNPLNFFHLFCDTHFVTREANLSLI